MPDLTVVTFAYAFIRSNEVAHGVARTVTFIRPFVKIAVSQKKREARIKDFYDYYNTRYDTIVSVRNSSLPLTYEELVDLVKDDFLICRALIWSHYCRRVTELGQCSLEEVIEAEKFRTDLKVLKDAYLLRKYDPESKGILVNESKNALKEMTGFYLNEQTRSYIIQVNPAKDRSLLTSFLQFDESSNSDLSSTKGDLITLDARDPTPNEFMDEVLCAEDTVLNAIGLPILVSKDYRNSAKLPNLSSALKKYAQARLQLASSHGKIISLGPRNTANQLVSSGLHSAVNVSRITASSSSTTKSNSTTTTKSSSSSTTKSNSNILTLRPVFSRSTSISSSKRSFPSSASSCYPPPGHTGLSVSSGSSSNLYESNRAKESSRSTRFTLQGSPSEESDN